MSDETSTPGAMFARVFELRRPNLPGPNVAHAPDSQGTIDAESRDALLQSIARARRWMDQTLEGKVSSTDEIAPSEDLAERHVRFLLPLAFLSPRIIEAIAKGSASNELTVSLLGRALPHAWRDQERRLLLG